MHEPMGIIFCHIFVHTDEQATNATRENRMAVCVSLSVRTCTSTDILYKGHPCASPSDNWFLSPISDLYSFSLALRGSDLDEASPAFSSNIALSGTPRASPRSPYFPISPTSHPCEPPSSKAALVRSQIPPGPRPFPGRLTTHSSTFQTPADRRELA